LIFGRIAGGKYDPGTQLAYRFELRGPLDAARLERALRLLLARYPALLSRFVRIDGTLYRQPVAMPEALLERLDETTGDPRAASAAVPLPLPPDRLFRFALEQVARDVHHLHAVFSHLVFDGECYHGWARLFSACYAAADGETAPPAVVADDSDPADLAQPIPEAAAAFWKDRLAGRPLGQALTFLKERREDNSGFFSVRRIVSGEDYRRIRAFAASARGTLFHVMAAACAVTIARYGAEDDYAEASRLRIR
jgi:hypothetical protein